MGDAHGGLQGGVERGGGADDHLDQPSLARERQQPRGDRHGRGGLPHPAEDLQERGLLGTPDATGTVAQFTGGGITVAVTGDATTALSARASDASNNDSACSNAVNYVEDSTSPAAPQITSTSPASPANDNNPEVKGSAEAGSTVRLYESLSCGGAIEAQGLAATFASPGLTATMANDVSVNFSATATDQAGNLSGCSTPFPYTEVSSDNVPPGASVTAPAAGSVVSGSVTVSANASDNVGVAGVQFLLDGASLGAEDTGAPYSISWDTTAASNGVHTLQARARDTAGGSRHLEQLGDGHRLQPDSGATGGTGGRVGVHESLGTTVNDVSGNGNTATLQNGPTWATGKFGGGLQFRRRQRLLDGSQLGFPESLRARDDAVDVDQPARGVGGTRCRRQVLERDDELALLPVRGRAGRRDDSSHVLRHRQWPCGCLDGQPAGRRPMEPSGDRLRRFAGALLRERHFVSSAPLAREYHRAGLAVADGGGRETVNSFGAVSTTCGSITARESQSEVTSDMNAPLSAPASDPPRPASRSPLRLMMRSCRAIARPRLTPPMTWVWRACSSTWTETPGPRGHDRSLCGQLGHPGESKWRAYADRARAGRRRQDDGVRRRST